MTTTNAVFTAQRQFPCSNCGANLQFEPGTDCLKCPYCGAEQRIPTVPQEIHELDYLT